MNGPSALQAEAPSVPVGDRAALVLGMYLKVVDRFDESRAWLQRMRTAADDEGDDSALPNTLGHLATLECWAGDYALALGYAIEARASAQSAPGCGRPWLRRRTSSPWPTWGGWTRPRHSDETDLAADESLGFAAAAALHLRSLGLAELIAGQCTAAAEHLCARNCDLRRGGRRRRAGDPSGARRRCRRSGRCRATSTKHNG